MYLSRITLQGFKTFAEKTILDLPEPTSDHRPLTVVVGPNGSGKSNLSDAIRWCLGEQSLKSLRGKEAQDVIFSGAEGRGRSGFAEVLLTFSHVPEHLAGGASEVMLGRRLYRDGESVYLFQGEEVRLQDVQMFLAEAGVGQRSYAVIGQGTIDHVLLASPEERKAFFDDAAGVRSFHMKRHQAMLKLQKASEHLAEVEMVLAELEPRVALLQRQVKNLQERDDVERRFYDSARAYYGSLWQKSREKERDNLVFLERIHGERSEALQAREAYDVRLRTWEDARKSSYLAQDAEARDAQLAYKQSLDALHEARREYAVCEQRIALERIRAESSWSPLPLQEIVKEVENLREIHAQTHAKLKTCGDISTLQDLLGEVQRFDERLASLHRHLVKPIPEAYEPKEEDALALQSHQKNIARAESCIHEAEERLRVVQAKRGDEKTDDLVALQRQGRELNERVLQVEQRLHAYELSRARDDAYREGLLREMRESLREEDILAVEQGSWNPQENPALHEEMRRLRDRLARIGSIDPEVVKEYQEARDRADFLSQQSTDARQAIATTRTIIGELDKEIAQTSDRAFALLQEEFSKYFAVLFGGGTCALHRVKKTEQDTSDGLDKDVIHEEVWSGVDIVAAPPGKTPKHLQLLSGGERALTAIALLCAVMATNPSPCVVLDEVDAALDEANTVRFANILAELRKKTQFIVITHNRATMEKADALYGVTMGGEGTSRLLSVKLEDIAQGDSARR